MSNSHVLRKHLIYKGQDYKRTHLDKQQQWKKPTYCFIKGNLTRSMAWADRNMLQGKLSHSYSPMTV